MDTDTLDNLTMTGVGEAAATRSAPPGPEVYRNVARRYLPVWREVIGAAPWLQLDHCHNDKDKQRFDTLADSVCAGVNLGFCNTDEEDESTRSLHRELVRATLVLWQSHLACDGRYLGRRDHPRAAYIIAQIVKLLCEVDGYAEPLLLADVARHLDHLARRSQRACWLEAACVAALGDGALLLRRTDMLRTARERLPALLARQSAEGWFPEQGGVDLGLLSLTIDALARLYHRHNWEELTEPLGRALRFLRHFVTPSGAVPTFGRTFGTGCLSPYGVELLAPTHVDANALAIILRRRYAAHAGGVGLSWSRAAALRIGSSAVLGARHGGTAFDAAKATPVPAQPVTSFDHAGLTIVQTSHYRAVVSRRHGGALWVWWTETDAVTQDQGVCVVFPNHTRTSGTLDRFTQVGDEHPTITCAGVLRRLQQGPRPTPALWRWLRRRFRSRRAGTTPHPPLSGTKPLTEAQHGALLHDHFRRDVTFHEDSIDIRDEVICRMSCQAVVCGSSLDTNTAPVDATMTERNAAAPLYLPGAKHTVVTRTLAAGVMGRVDQLDFD